MIDFFKGLSDKVWGGLLAVLALFFFFKQEKKLDDAEAVANTAESDKRDAVLAEKQDGVAAQITEAQAQGEAAKAVPLTPEELAKELDKV